MNKIKTETTHDDDMRREYDFSGKAGVRGKYARAYRQGHAVRIDQPDGSVTVQYFTLEEGAIMLDADVKTYFPTAEAVNSALRALIALIPSKPTRRTAETKAR